MNDLPPVRRIISGPHVGRQGKVVSDPWFGNLFHLLVTLNVPAVHQPPPGPFVFSRREWLTVWRWQTEVISP
jgi:hypothetical protein